MYLFSQSTNALIIWVKNQWKEKNAKESIPTTNCQTFWKPMEIEGKNYREQMQNQEN